MRALLLLALTTPAFALTADEIIARLAANQDLAEHQRSTFVYRQRITIRVRDTHGKLMREEISDYQVTPQDQNTHRQLIHFNGRYSREGTMVAYRKSGEGDDESDGFRQQADAHMSHNLRQSLAGHRDTKDGLSPALFPLTTKELAKYRFTLKGHEHYQGVAAWRIRFAPKENSTGDVLWKGEVLVSQSDFEPLSISTRLAAGVPFWVRTALGTNVPGLGFSIEYRKFAEGVWFPISCGTEFRVRVLFIYSRHVSISMANSDFRRAPDGKSAHEWVTSSVEFAAPQ